MALFRRSKADRQAEHWRWDPRAAGLSGEQLWALLTNALYFRASSARLDALGGALHGLDWRAGLESSWGVTDVAGFDELVTWMRTEGHRAEWAADGTDDGDEKLAWDQCRIMILSGGAWLAELIDEDRAWAETLAAADALSDRFDSWSALGWNYVEGRRLWLQDQGIGNDQSQLPFEAAAHELVSEASSPWQRVDWDRTNGVVIDGERFD